MESSKFTALVLGGSLFASAWVLSSGMQSLGQGIAQAGLALASGLGANRTPNPMTYQIQLSDGGAPFRIEPKAK